MAPSRPLLLALVLCSAMPVSASAQEARAVAEPAAAEPAAAEPAPAEDPEAVAIDDARARELYLQGDRLYAEGDYGAAIEAFRESYELSARPLMLFNLANAYERAGRYQEAADALRAYQPNAAPGERDALTRRILRLQSRARQAEAAAAPAPAPEPASAPAPEPRGETVVLAPRDDTLAWMLAGGGAGLLVLGSLAAAVASSARLDAEDLCSEGVCPMEAKDAVDRDGTYSLLADVGFIVGGGALATGVVLLLLPGTEVVEHARLSIGADHAALGYRAAF